MPKPGLPRRLRMAVPLAGALCSFIVFLLVLRVWKGAGGYDVYYYALQIKSLSRCGELLFFDFSLVYYALFLINLLARNPVLSVQLLSSLSMAVIYYCLLKMSLYRSFSLYKIAAASIAVFNPASFYLLLEFTKNSFALALFFLSILFLSRSPRLLTGGTFFGLLFGLGAFFSHRIILALIILFFIHQAAARLWAERRGKTPGSEGRRQGRFLIIALGGGIVLILLAAVLLTVIFWRKFFPDRMPPLDISAPLRRLALLNGPRLWPEERLFYILLQVSLFLLIPWSLMRKPLRLASLFGVLAWLFLFPLLRFSWDGTGFRLLIMAPLFAAPWLMEQDLKSFSRLAGILLIAGSVFFSVRGVQRLAPSKGPDYALYERELSSLETLAAGRRIIAHRGLAGFLWYEKGVRSENFIPPAEEDRYLRLVYFYSPEFFEPYVRDGEARPIAVGGGYTLMEEYIWRRFYQDRQDLAFLRSELNPYLPRPASGFALNEKAAALISPVSDPPGP